MQFSPIRLFSSFLFTLLILGQFLTSCDAQKGSQNQSDETPAQIDCSQSPANTMEDQLFNGKLEKNPAEITTLFLRGENSTIELPEMKNLRRVVVIECEPPFSLAFLADSKCLESLEIDACSDLEGLKIPFQDLKDLKRLSIRNSEYIGEEIFDLVNLTSLSLTRMDGFTPLTMNWAGLAKLKNLEIIEVIKSNLADVNDLLAQAPNLRELRIVDAQITEISDKICDLKQLTAVDLRSNEVANLPACVAKITDM